MNRRNGRFGGSSSNNQEEEGVDLKLNLSVSVAPPVAVAVAVAAAGGGGGRHRISTSSSSESSSESSPPRSCVSSEDSLKYSSSPESTSMVLVGCSRCLMYVMLSEADPRCPKCKSTVLLDFNRSNNNHRQH